VTAPRPPGRPAFGASSRLGRGDDPVALSDVLGTVADRLGAGPAPVLRRVFTAWEELVGPAVAAHVRPLRVDGPTLVVVVDHPAWVTQLRALAPDILARVCESVGDGAPDGEAPVTRLDARVRPPG
jgi:predicted nucleic acid-binding Zn ribbon protein